MKVTLVDVQQPKTLFCLLNAMEGPALCGGVDLRNNPKLEDLICGMAAPGKGIPQLELTVTTVNDLSSILHYMREGGKTAA